MDTGNPMRVSCSCGEAHAHEYLWAQGSRRIVLAVSLKWSTTEVFERRSLLGLSLNCCRLGWLDSELQRQTCLSVHRAVIIGTDCHAGLFLSRLCLIELRSSCLQVKTLPIELPSRS